MNTGKFLPQKGGIAVDGGADDASVFTDVVADELTGIAAADNQHADFSHFTVAEQNDLPLSFLLLLL